MASLDLARKSLMVATVFCSSRASRRSSSCPTSFSAPSMRVRASWVRRSSSAEVTWGERTGGGSRRGGGEDGAGEGGGVGGARGGGGGRGGGGEAAAGGGGVTAGSLVLGTGGSSGWAGDAGVGGGRGGLGGAGTGGAEATGAARGGGGEVARTFGVAAQPVAAVSAVTMVRMERAALIAPVSESSSA